MSVFTNSFKTALILVAACVAAASAAGRAAAQTITEFALPSDAGIGDRGDFLTGSDGAVWFATSTAGKLAIGRISKDGQITRFSTGRAACDIPPNGMALASDGAIWFIHCSLIMTVARITPDGTITEFAIPDSNPAGLRPMTAGADGGVWVAGRGNQTLYRVTTVGAVTPVHLTFPILIEGMVTGPDRNFWATDGGDRIWSISPDGVALAHVVQNGPHTTNGITSGPDGALWFTNSGSNSIGRITTAGVITLFSIPTADSFPESITAGADGAIWFAEEQVSKIGRITISGHITEFPLPSFALSGPRGIAATSDGSDLGRRA